MEDIFYTEYSDRENENKIYNIEEQNNIDRIKNDAFNQGYLLKASEFNENEYNKGFKDGENYSIEYGKLLGIIECINFFKDNVFKTNKISEEIINEINKISEELGEFKEKLNQDIINSFSQKLDLILKEIINI